MLKLLPLRWDWFLKRLYDFVLSTRVLRPSLSTVRSVLPASSGSAKDLAARHGFHFRVTVVFSSVLLHRRTVSYSAVILPLQRTANPQILRILCILCICSWYLLSILLYSCLFYNVNIDVVCVSGTVSGSMAEMVFTRFVILVTLCSSLCVSNNLPVF